MRPRGSADEHVYLEIKKRILDGSLIPGARLVLRTIAKELDISLTPVSLALRMLERDGLVVVIPGMGAYVRMWDSNDIIQLYEIRAFHEALAARLCAREARKIDLDRIAEKNEQFRRSIDADDVEANIQADIELHTAIVRGARNPDLARITENLSIMACSMRLFALSLKVPSSTTRNLRLSKDLRDVHQPLIEAIVDRNLDIAESEGRKHVEESLERNRVWIENIKVLLENNPSEYGLLLNRKISNLLLG